MLSELAVDERKTVETFVFLGSRIKMDRVLELILERKTIADLDWIVKLKGFSRTTKIRIVKAVDFWKSVKAKHKESEREM